jgi:hypothetical protein
MLFPDEPDIVGLSCCDEKKVWAYFPLPPRPIFPSKKVSTACRMLRSDKTMWLVGSAAAELRVGLAEPAGARLDLQLVRSPPA